MFDCLVNAFTGASALRMVRDSAQFANAPLQEELKKSFRFEVATLIGQYFVQSTKVEYTTRGEMHAQ